ncbi:MAG: hypothetical protein UY63_C0005G0015 [Parcubacteria group bacterium GW2011_GWA2_51_10]|nr:MAG: hypothetical protein UY63_C0005G0015 [Parcubacteria group bacterium GW2011_GWA2_51_10]
MKLAADIRNSFYSPETYQNLRSSGFGRAVRFSFIASLISAIAALIMMVITFYPFMNATFIEQLVAFYPSELVVTINNGVVSTNVEEPYTISFPDRVEANTNDGPGNFVVIDTTEALTLEDVKAYDAWIVLGKSTLYAAGANELRAIDLSGNKEEIIISKSFVEEIARKAKPFVTAGIVLLPLIASLFLLLFGMIGYLILGIFGALAAMLIARVGDMRLHYREGYVVSLYAIIPVAVFDAATDFIESGNSFWLGLAVFLVVLVANLHARRDASTVA